MPMLDASTDCSAAALSWLATLIAFPTISGSSSNLDLLRLAEQALRARGFAVRYTYSPDGKRANLYASHGGATGGILLSGHTDVVPVAGQDWSRPSFTLTEDGERLYGRGACDMKGFLACVLAVLQRIDLAALRQPVHVAFTYDEEIGCVGVRGLIKDLAEAGIRPAACIVGEPTRMAVIRAHKGRQAWRCCVQGRAAHSSLSGTGVNAAETACELVADIARQARQLQRDEVDENFLVPYSTMAVCRVHGGTATNVIPEAAEFDFDLRFLPSTDPERALAPVHERAAALQAGMRDREPEARITLERRTAVPALTARPDEDRLVQALFAAGAAGGSHVAFTTEGGLYQAAGIPTVICGPGDIAQAHTADEFVLRSQLAACESVLERVLLA
ncbi:acetylornithine deacetylase [Achromobacter sp. Marseille-Q0513]|uniref:acetylornithine deacetylase n=1 Tax=Achromobacter sp. Marseille-Q0513 TaxID=2829161 RepID=UPI00201382A1|nr:acetylornithine deacetylase [Achromobacter sp. Marseille-Q0513]